jgi:predicted RNase H-like HicB family nuclease
LAGAGDYAPLGLKIAEFVGIYIPMTKTYSAVIYREDNWYVAECPEVGTASQGQSIEEALNNLREATELYLEEFPTTGSMHPILTTFEIAV